MDRGTGSQQPEPIGEYVDTEIPQGENDKPAKEERKKFKKPKKQASCLDILLDMKALVLASHDRSRRYGILLDRLHDCVILMILFISSITLVCVAVFGAVGTPRGYRYSQPAYHQVVPEVMKGETIIKHQFDDFSPHNGRFSYKMRFPYNCSYAGLRQDDFTIYVSVRGMKDKKGSDWKQVEGLQTNRRRLRCEQSGLRTTELYGPDSKGNYHQRYITADTPMCKPMTILYDNPTFKVYEVEVRIDQKEEVLYNLNLISGYIETWYSMNSSNYTTFEWIMRLIFSITSAFFFIFFTITMIRSQKFGVWITQQKWLALLLFLLIFYHDPLYVADVYSGWYIFPIIETILAMTFVFTFFLYLLIFFHSLFKPPKERTFFNFWLTKLLIILPMYVLTIGLFTASRLYDHADPSHDSIRDIEFFYYVEIADTILFLIYFFMLGYYFFKAIGNARRMRKHYSARFKIVGGLSFIVVVSFIGLSVSWGVFRFDSPGFQFIVSHTLILMYFGWLTIFFLPSTNIEENRPKTSVGKKHGKKKYQQLEDEADGEGMVGGEGEDAGGDGLGGPDLGMARPDFETVPDGTGQDDVEDSGVVHERKESVMDVLEMGEHRGTMMDEPVPETPTATSRSIKEQKEIEMEDIKVKRSDDGDAEKPKSIKEQEAEEDMENVFDEVEENL